MPRVHFVPLASDAAMDAGMSPASLDGVFAMEGEPEPLPSSLPFEQTAAAGQGTAGDLARLLQPANDVADGLARHVELAVGGAHRADCAALCSLLQRLGYSAKLHESTASLHSFKQGVRHQYISVVLPDTGSTGLSTYVVDPNFRDSFCIAHPTPRFAAVLDAAPPALVASKAVLHRAVTILAREMARSFADQGEDLPPWRTTQALLSKWQLSGSPAAGSAGAGCSAWAAGQGQGWQAAGQLFPAAGKQHAAFGAA